MSDLNQIQTALERLFHEEGQRIVFWNDPDREFQNTLPLLSLDGVTTLRLDEVGALGAKYRLEREEPTGKFLLYAPTEEPDYEDDWLLEDLYCEKAMILDAIGRQDEAMATFEAGLKRCPESTILKAGLEPLRRERIRSTFKVIPGGLR